MELFSINLQITINPPTKAEHSYPVTLHPVSQRDTVYQP
jgi:hypothetical protein